MQLLWFRPAQTIATACLHLAAKVGESPKPIREVVRECEKIIHQKHPEHLAMLNDPVSPQALDPDMKQTQDIALQCLASSHAPALAFRTDPRPSDPRATASRAAHAAPTQERGRAYLELQKDQILLAERAVLYTLGFDLDVEHPHSYMLKSLATLGGDQAGASFPGLYQNAWNFMGDGWVRVACVQGSDAGPRGRGPGPGPRGARAAGREEGGRRGGCLPNDVRAPPAVRHRAPPPCWPGAGSAQRCASSSPRRSSRSPRCTSPTSCTRCSTAGAWRS